MKDQELDKLLLAAFFRRDCPETMKLGDYHSGLLKGPEILEIRSHLEKCPHCTSEMARLEGFLKFLEPKAVYEPTLPWIEAAGFVWRRLQDRTQLVIRLMKDSIVPPPVAMPIGVKSSSDDDETVVLQEIYLSPEETDGFEVNALVLADPENIDLCIVKLRVQTLTRWPELGGTKVLAAAGDWAAEGTTDNEGEVLLTGLKKEFMEKLQIEINLKGGSE